MRKILVLVIAAMFLAVSCGGGESKTVVEEKSQTISAEEGGEIEVAGGAAKIKIPAGALASDKEISVKLFKTDGFNNKKALASNVVEFGPEGTIFKKPVLITITAEKAVSGKTIAAAVMKSDGTWSFSKEGSAVKISGYDEAGDPIMTTAAGDPIMLNSEGSVVTEAGNPIASSAAGDPIMVSAAGDPIMNAAAGDPIMMTSGHFSTFTFVVVDEVKEEDKNGKSGDVTCKTAREWDKVDGQIDGDYEDEDNDSIYCDKTGEEIVYCIVGAFTGETSDIYSIKVDGKEFKCSGNNADCVLEMGEYCGNIDGEYDDGYYCEEQGECEKTGETAKYCASTSGDGNFYYQVGDRKFECTHENIESCYNDFYDYCGDTAYDDEPGENEPAGLICRTESEWAEEYSDEEHHVWICETTGLEISICIPDTFNMEDMEEGEFPPFYSIETGGETFYCDPSTADTTGTIGDYSTSMDCYHDAEEYCTPQ